MITKLEMSGSGSNLQERSAVAPRTASTGLEGTVTLKESGERERLDWLKNRFVYSTTLACTGAGHIIRISSKS